jgi:hypothetical protein
MPNSKSVSHNEIGNADFTDLTILFSILRFYTFVYAGWIAPLELFVRPRPT